MDPMDGGKRDAAVHIDENMHIQHLIDVNEHTSKRSRGGGEEFAGGSSEDILLRTAMRRDRAVANYYKRLTINNDILFFQDMLSMESLNEAMKRNIKNKLAILLVKKQEDRYDDVNI